MTRIQSKSSPAAATALALLAGVTVLGCSAHSPVATSGVGAGGSAPRPVGRARIADRHEVGGGDERRALEAREILESSFAAGQAALLAGEEDVAFDNFDTALEAVMGSEVDLQAHPDLLARAEDVVAAIHDLAAAVATQADDAELDLEHPRLDGVAAADAVDPIEIAAGTYANLTIPMVKHPAVDALIRFYTGRGKAHFETGLERYGKYAPTVARILEEEGVPAELAWLALVESNYNAQAYSRARARGLWQFIPGTGRLYGLKQDYWVDERSDFEKATHASARYLKALHGMFGDWHLAIAAYNAGEGKIGRAIRSTGRRDFWRIRETRYIRRETKDYVPAFLAVLTVVQDPAAYGVSFKPATPLSWETTSVSAATDLAVIARCADTSVECIQELNPELRRGTTPGNGDAYALRIPAGRRAIFAEKYAALPPEQLLTWRRHVVANGETLAGIARAYGSSTGSIMAANNLKSSTIGTGATLVIPQGPHADTLPASVLAGRAPDFGGDAAAGGTRHTYRVRPGDTLSKIAARFGTSATKLAGWNGLRNSNRIHVGQRLVLYGGRSTSAARSTGQADGTHVVRSGDTLSGIARSHGISLATLRDLNGLGSTTTIRPGQRLAVSGAARTARATATASATARRTHTVRRGETLSAIARQYRCSVDSLCAWNAIRKTTAIHPGDRLAIRDN